MKRRTRSSLLHANVYRAIATILPALLGQGLIYLCVMGRLELMTAVVAILAMGTVVLTAAAILKSESQVRLVRGNAPPIMYGRRFAATR